MAGFLSAGGKPFKVPVYNWILGHYPVAPMPWLPWVFPWQPGGALTAQVAVGQPIAVGDLGLAIYEFIIITLVALGIERIGHRGEGDCDLDHCTNPGAGGNPVHPHGNGLILWD